MGQVKQANKEKARLVRPVVEVSYEKFLQAENKKKGAK